MRYLVLVAVAALALPACQSGKSEQVDAKESKPASDESRVLDPGGAMSDPNARILIGGNQVGPAPENPKPEPLNHAVDEEPPKPNVHPHEGH